ncbi:hypothetical protein AALO_G00053420 [Alosa alosa]|uniref:Uncharacterized protein n=1 Tax=Alosa alosa TaxID=278164 RepID=A0AAV6H6I6_9TELE|nr:hypothetical protein AALO_G00053420 [Alosa alosa]
MGSRAKKPYLQSGQLDVVPLPSTCRTTLVNSWTSTSPASALLATESSVLRTMPPFRSTLQKLIRLLAGLTASSRPTLSVELSVEWVRLMTPF